MNDKNFISVDWGTTNLRIRLVSLPTLEIIEEIKSPKGVKTINKEWLEKGGDRELHFSDFLKTQLIQFNTEINPTIPIVLSGMASSSIGLRELPYSVLPFESSGNTLHVELVKSDSFPYYLTIISGVQSSTDVIRGEEVQIVGLFEQEDTLKSIVFIFPGTHSKHIICEKGIVTNFRTFMTGELFEVISEHTILSSSIKNGHLNKAEWVAFEEGVLQTVKGISLLNSLFRIRTHTLFKEKTEIENSFYLSGLLIGEEIRTLTNFTCDTIKLCAGGVLYELYYRAIDILGLLDKTEIISKEIVDNSVIKGQWKILKEFRIKNKNYENPI
jgi:2-dehydro-3-deoxygalactonokinase